MKIKEETNGGTKETWEKMHAAYVALPNRNTREYPTLRELAKRFRIPLREAERKASCGYWDEERAAIEARDYFGNAPGIKTEVAFCLHYAATRIRDLGSDLGAIGGQGLLEDVISDARVIWRRRMSSILVWEAMLASNKYLKPDTQRAA